MSLASKDRKVAARSSRSELQNKFKAEVASNCGLLWFSGYVGYRSYYKPLSQQQSRNGSTMLAGPRYRESQRVCLPSFSGCCALYCRSMIGLDTPQRECRSRYLQCRAHVSQLSGRAVTSDFTKGATSQLLLARATDLGGRAASLLHRSKPKTKGKTCCSFLYASGVWRK